MEKEVMLHFLRNPYGINELDMRKARLQAANELERLYKFEKDFKTYIESLEIKNSELLKFDKEIQKGVFFHHPV